VKRKRADLIQRFCSLYDLSRLEDKYSEVIYVVLLLKALLIASANNL